MKIVKSHRLLYLITLYLLECNVTFKRHNNIMYDEQKGLYMIPTEWSDIIYVDVTNNIFYIHNEYELYDTISRLNVISWKFRDNSYDDIEIYTQNIINNDLYSAIIYASKCLVAVNKRKECKKEEDRLRTHAESMKEQKLQKIKDEKAEIKREAFRQNKLNHFKKIAKRQKKEIDNLVENNYQLADKLKIIYKTNLPKDSIFIVLKAFDFNTISKILNMLNELNLLKYPLINTLIKDLSKLELHNIHTLDVSNYTKHVLVDNFLLNKHSNRDDFYPLKLHQNQITELRNNRFMNIGDIITSSRHDLIVKLGEYEANRIISLLGSNNIKLKFIHVEPDECDTINEVKKRVQRILDYNEISENIISSFRYDYNSVNISFDYLINQYGKLEFDKLCKVLMLMSNFKAVPDNKNNQIIVSRKIYDPTIRIGGR